MLSNITASFIIIGNEILSGRTQDKNLNYLAKILNNLGISLQETRIIPDIEAEIIATVNSLSKKYTYVFTSGGIGPTHDDITSLCIAKAFSDELIIHQEAKEILTSKMESLIHFSELLQNNTILYKKDITDF